MKATSITSTPEQMENGRKNQAQILDGIGNSITELTALGVSGIHAGGYLVALHIENLDEIYGKPTRSMKTVLPDQSLPSGIYWGITKCSRKITSTRGYVWSIPCGEVALRTAIRRVVDMPVRTPYVLANTAGTWHLDSATAMYDLRLLLNYWRGLEGVVDVEFGMPMTTEQVSLFANPSSGVAERETAANAIPKSDTVSAIPGTGLIFPGSFRMSWVNQDVAQTGAVHRFSPVSGPKYSAVRLIGPSTNRPTY